MREYAKDLADRAIKTAAQAALLTIGADQLDVFAADWRTVLGMAAGGAVLSLLTNVAERGIRGHADDA